MSGFKLPPKVSVRKERIAGQWVYKFRHEEMGQLGRIVLQGRADGKTQANCELAGDPEEPMFEKRAAIFKPLALELIQKMHMATGGEPDVPLEKPMTPKGIRGVGSKHFQCEKCRANVALIIFAEGARTLGELEDYARLMFPQVREMDVPTWVIGEPVGNDPLPERPADILKIWPEREPVQRLRPDEFNPVIDELMATHCD